MDTLNALLIIGFVLGLSHAVALRGVRTGLTYRFWFLLMVLSAGVLAPYFAVWVFIFRRKPKTFGNIKEMQKDWANQAVNKSILDSKKSPNDKDLIKLCEECKKPIQYGSPFAKEFQERIDNGTGRIRPTYSPSGNWNQQIHEPFAESERKQ